MNAREYFRTTDCTNPWHEFKVGNFVLMWRWANDKWTTITSLDMEQTHWFRIGTIRNMKGKKAYEIVIGKLLVIWGVAS